MLSLPKTSKDKGDSYFTITFSALREIVVEALENRGKVRGISNSQNAAKIKDHTVDVNSFHGYTASQLERWLKRGIQNRHFEFPF